MAFAAPGGSKNRSIGAESQCVDVVLRAVETTDGLLPLQIQHRHIAARPPGGEQQAMKFGPNFLAGYGSAHVPSERERADRVPARIWQDDLLALGKQPNGELAILLSPSEELCPILGGR